jgi:hypothetical protein
MWVAVNLHEGKDGQSFMSSVLMLFTKLNFEQHNLVLYLLQQRKFLEAIVIAKDYSKTHLLYVQQLLSRKTDQS